MWEQLTTQEEHFVNLETWRIPLLDSTHIKTKVLFFFYLMKDKHNILCG